MADHGLREGQQLGNYRLTRLLGQGGFAEVYLGEHIYLKSRAALKVLHTQLSEQDTASFVQEAQTLANLSHPHIVRVLDFAVQDGTGDRVCLPWNPAPAPYQRDALAT